MLLLVGLGNPGSQYQNTRHNVGWWALDAIAKRYGFPAFRKKGKAELAEGKIEGAPCLLVKPLTFMNLSGEAVQPLMAFHKVPLKNIIVFQDELAVPAGKIKVKQGGGAAGHNGLKSLDQHIGKDYWRVRIGIGHPGAPELVTGYVLGRPPAPEYEALEKTVNSIAENLPLLLEAKPSVFIEKSLVTNH